MSKYDLPSTIGPTITINKDIQVKMSTLSILFSSSSLAVSLYCKCLEVETMSYIHMYKLKMRAIIYVIDNLSQYF